MHNLDYFTSQNGIVTLQYHPYDQYNYSSNVNYLKSVATVACQLYKAGYYSLYASNMHVAYYYSLYASNIV